MIRPLFAALLSVVFYLMPVLAQNAPGWPFDEITLRAPDGSVTAKFVSIGATLTELWVRDKNGKPRDVVLGYDDNTKLWTDPGHPVFNGIVGRYANRIKNGTFSIPISRDPVPGEPGVYEIPRNDRDGAQTLHGGIYGWDRRNFTLVARTTYSVTYRHLDTADEGFPGNVTAHVTHSVANGGVLRTLVHASATELTPIMLTQHIYWNLDAFEGTDDIFNHSLRLAAGRVLEVDSLAIPSGNFINVAGTAYDFRRPQQIGARWNDTYGFPGDYYGYDNCWILDRQWGQTPVVTLSSSNSGIKLEVTTNQPAVQVYTGNWLDTPRKAAHGGSSKTYGKQSAVAIEQQGYVAAINTPSFGIDQIHGPGDDYTWSSTYKFTVAR